MLQFLVLLMGLGKIISTANVSLQHLLARRLPSERLTPSKAHCFPQISTSASLHCLQHHTAEVQNASHVSRLRPAFISFFTLFLQRVHNMLCGQALTFVQTPFQLTISIFFLWLTL